VAGVDPLLALVEAAREGDDRAAAELVRRTQPAVWSLCSALGGRDVCEDLVQETFLRAFRALGSFRGDAPVSAWLLSIARRTCADHVRHMQRHRRLRDRLARLAERPPPAAERSSLDLLIRALDPSRREVFVLTQELGLSYAQAAEVVGCPVGTIRSRLARARADLLEAMRADEAR
jgi:RNA polymerase sigma-70 factor, ECF subfamily